MAWAWDRLAEHVESLRILELSKSNLVLIKMGEAWEPIDLERMRIYGHYCLCLLPNVWRICGQPSRKYQGIQFDATCLSN